MNPKKYDFEKIAAYLQGQLGADERNAIKKKIEQDPVLRSFIDASRELIDEVGDGYWKQVEPSVHALLSRQLQELKQARKNPRRQYGITTFDSKLLPVPEGVRPATVDSRRIKIQLRDGQLDLSLYPVSTGSFEIIGQILDWQSTQVMTMVLESRSAKLAAETNQFHLFQFPRVPCGKYTLKIKDGRSVVAAIDLEI